MGDVLGCAAAAAAGLGCGMMKRFEQMSLRWVYVWLFFGVLAAITFRCAWAADMVFSASDLNVGRLALKKQLLPELLVGQFWGNQVLGGSGYGLTLFHGLLALMPLELFADGVYGLILVVGSVSMVWFLRLWGRSWLASVFGALVAFWVNSVLLAASGHAYKMAVLAFSVLALALIEKAVRAVSGRRLLGWSLLAGLTVGGMMMEQQDVALLAGLFVAPYAVLRAVQMRLSGGRWVGLFVPLALVALLFSGATVWKSYTSNIRQAAGVQGEAGAKWDYITQWSMVPDEWPDLIAPGWSGWHTGHAEAPYWGRIGQSAGFEETGKGFRNFRLDSSYMGMLPFGFALLGCVLGWRGAERGFLLFWLVACLVGLGLAFGRYSLLYRGFFELPLVSSIRAPIKLLDNAQVALGILAAFGMDGLLRLGAGKRWSWLSWLVLAGILLGASVGVYLFPEGWRSRFDAAGVGMFSDALLGVMASSWRHAAGCALLGAVAAGLVVWRRVRLAGLLLVAGLCVDSLLLTTRYFKADDVGAVRRGNPVIHYLKEHQGLERSAFLDQGGIYNQWLGMDGPFHGLQLFNIWQMPRMPVEYEVFLREVGRNQLRLWELAAVRHVCAPASVFRQLEQHPVLGDAFEPVLRYQVPTAQGMREDVVLRYERAIPRFALFENWMPVAWEEQCGRLVDEGHDPGLTVLVEPESGLGVQRGGARFKALEAEVSKRWARVEVAQERAGVVRFSQRYQPGWRVFVDGEEAALLRLDYVSMGVWVPAGAHTVEFRCVSGVAPAVLSGGVLVLALAGAGGCLRKRG